MDFSLSDDQAVLTQSVARLISASASDRELLQRFIDFGIFQLAHGLSEGEDGASAVVDIALVFEELGKAAQSTPAILNGLIATTLIGRSAGHRALLSSLLDGTSTATLSYLEPDRGYAADPVTTTFRRADGSIVLDGEKVYVSGGADADTIIVSALGEDGRPGLIVVPREADGLAVQGYQLIDGSSAADLALRGVRLPASALLDGVDQACLDRVLDLAALWETAETVGCMEAIIGLTADYVSTRRQFGKVIGSFQSIQHQMADMVIAVEMARSAVFAALGDFHTQPAVRARSVSAAKVQGIQSGRTVGNTGIQLHGGIGMAIENAVGRYHHRIVASAHRFGDLAFHRRRFTKSRDDTSLI